MGQDPSNPANGETLSAPGFKLGRVLGRGGQAVVYEAFQVSTGRKVAIKFLRHGRHSAATELARLEREGSFLTSVSHSCIVRVLDRGVANGSAYLVMEFVDGEPFDKWARATWRPANEGGALDQQRRVLEVLVKICNGVEAAHSKGFAHRDLKPSNVLIDRSGEPRLLDFGMARAFADTGQSVADPSLTVTGEFIGSLPWASPEQVEGKDTLLPSSDVYALGVMLYQALTGEFPYDVTGATSKVMRNITSAAPSPPSRIVSARLARFAERDADGSRPAPALVSEELDEITLRALAKTPEERYTTAGSLAADLTRAIRGEPTQAGVQARRRARRALLRNSLVAGMAIVVLVIAGVVLFPLIRDALWGGSLGASDASSVQNATAGRPRPAIKVGVVVKPAVEDTPPPVIEKDSPINTAVLSQAVLPVKGVRSWTLETRGPRGGCLSVDLSPDGARLAVGSGDGTIRIINSDTGDVEQLLIGHAAGVRDLSWSNDGKCLASCDQTAVWIWEVPSGKPIHYYLSPTMSVTWSPDGKRLAIGKSSVQIVTLEDPKALREFVKVPTTLQELRWSPDGKRIAGAGVDGKVYVWDVASGNELGPVAAHQGLAYHVGWTQTGDLFSSGQDGKVRKWTLASGTVKSVDLAQSVTTAGFSIPFRVSPDGAKVFVTPDFGNYLLREFSDPVKKTTLKGHTNWPAAAVWSADGKVIYTVSQDCSVRKWDTATGAVDWITNGHMAKLYTCEQSPNGQWLAAVGKDSDLWVLNTINCEPKRQIKTGIAEGGNPFFQVSWSHDSRTLIMSTKGNKLRRFIVEDDKELTPLVFANGVRGVAFAPGDDRLAVVEGSKLHILSTKSDQEEAVHAFDGEGREGISWSPDGRRVAVFVQGKTFPMVYVFDIDSGGVLKSSLSSLARIAWSPNGNQIYAPFPGQGIYNAADLKPAEYSVIPGKPYVTSGTWSPDGGSFAVTTTDGYLLVYDSALKSLRAKLAGSYSVSQIDWSRDGKSLALAGLFETTVRIWNMPEGKIRGVFAPLSKERWLRIDSMGRWLGSTGVSEELLVFVVTDTGERLTLPMREFEARFGATLGVEQTKAGEAAATSPASAGRRAR